MYIAGNGLKFDIINSLCLGLNWLTDLFVCVIVHKGALGELIF